MAVVIRRIHRELDPDFQINSIKDRRITTGRVNQKEILQRESHMRIRTSNKLGGENQRIKESLNRVHQEGFGSGYPRANDEVKRCHHCNSDQHFVRDCDEAKGNQNTQEKRADFRTMRVNSVNLQPLHLDSQEAHQNLNVNGVKSDHVWLDFYGNQFDPNNPTVHRDSAQNARVNQIQVRPAEKVSEETNIKVVMKCGVNLKQNYQEIMPEQIVVKQTVKKDESNALKKIQLKHVTVEIRGKETDIGSIVKVNALSDSGAKIPVISEELIEGMNLEQEGEVSLQGVAGKAIPAKLVKVDDCVKRLVTLMKKPGQIK